MSSHVKLRKERVSVVDYDIQIKEVRSQLVDQLKVLDLQLEQKNQQLQDLTDYLRRRGEIESEYARSLEKLAERFTSRIKRKEPSSNSVSQAWLTLLSQTRQESRDHNGLSESCSNFLTQPLTHCVEYTQRLAKKVLLQALTHERTAVREKPTTQNYHSDYVCAEGKLREAEKQEEKQKQSANKKLERLIEKRQIKVQEIKLKCNKARNEYLLNLAAANSSMNKYYLQDISTLIDCADTGYHTTLGRVVQAYLSRRWKAQDNLSTGLQQIEEAVSRLDQSRDRDILLQDNYNTFSMPLRFPYQPHDGDQVTQVSAKCEMICELETRFKQIQTRLQAVTQETEEVNKSMSAAQASLLEGIGDDLEPSSQEGSTENLTVKPSATRRRANLQEIEYLYFTKVKEYLVGSSLVSKLQVKHDLLKEAVEKGIASAFLTSMRVRKNHSSANSMHNQKLFNGDMLSFITASGQQIPIVVESCIRYINLHGESSFVPWASPAGEDPLAEGRYDLDSVAGVLKLYFRGLENPLFPLDSTNVLLEHAPELKAVISSFPEPAIIVMRYLFAFLYHVSEYSDENMMQPYNLAVCFGPSLIRGAHDDDVVTLQPQINALVKGIIIEQESIFPTQSEVPGPVYEKCMTLELDDGYSEKSLSSHNMQGLRGVLWNDYIMLFTSQRDQLMFSKLLCRVISYCQEQRADLEEVLKSKSRENGHFPPCFLSYPYFFIFTLQDVCRQMDSVFKELLIRQTHQDPTSTVSSPSVQTPQKKGKQDGRRGRGTGLFKSADAAD
uniref:Rho GTPase activating protein 4a n=1 Tax=Neolamprologus brichardi TaxID=32507 RepID=A0A3Q4MU12_NEOBR